MSDETKNHESCQRGIKMTRLFNAKRDLVFSAWTEAKYVARWSGAAGFSVPVCEINPRTGGSIHMIMQSPNGIELPMTGLYREVVVPSLISLVVIANDKEGNPRLDMLITATFTEHGNDTELNVETTYMGTEAVTTPMMEGVEASWKETLARLGVLIKEIVAAQ